MPTDTLIRPHKKEIEFLKLIESRPNHQVELRENYKPSIDDLAKRGYIKLNDAFTMPFKTPTGTKFAILTEAGRLALALLEREVSLSQY